MKAYPFSSTLFQNIYTKSGTHKKFLLKEYRWFITQGEAAGV
jgi:hypothetical protein